MSVTNKTFERAGWDVLALLVCKTLHRIRSVMQRKQKVSLIQRAVVVEGNVSRGIETVSVSLYPLGYSTILGDIFITLF